MGVIFGPKYQKAHPYAKIVQIDCLACASGGVLTLNGAEKSTRGRPLETRVVYKFAAVEVDNILCGCKGKLKR